ncbi:MAG: ATP-dependent DNA helicase [Acidimicrobiia bacterium]
MAEWNEVLERAVRALGGDDRPGQRALAAAVHDAITGCHHLVAEAPTGSGKSLAYLAPAVTSGKRVVVATATLTLQDQLWHKDLPHLREHGGVEFRAAVLKGRSQYVCRAKLDRARTGDALFDERPGPGFDRDVERLVRFAASSATGDFAEVDVAEASRRAASCAPMECPGAAKCSDGDTCFAELARKRATEAEVLVVNHALYCVNLESGGAVLPEHDLVVFDEAQGLADVATTAFGIDITPMGLRQLASRLTGVGIARGDGDLIASAADALEGALAGADGRVDPTAGALADALGAAAERLASALPAIDAGDDPTAAAQTAQLGAARLAALRRVRAPETDEVVWVERNVLHLAPVDVSRALARRLFELTPTVLTSATLGGGPRFSAFTRRIGLDPGAEPGPHTVTDADGDSVELPGLGYVDLAVASPFDFRAQAMLYVPRHLPEPRDPAWAEAATAETTRLVDAAGGRALILCTSRAAVDRMAAALRRDTDHPVLVQGETAKAVLLERFGAEETSCLVATRSFWTGVDIPGPSCVLVVLDRLPFARPDDPLAQARREKAEREGGSGFFDVDVPAAALVLAQGAGRLIRSRHDRGVVAVLDRRLATARYRSAFLDALPPMRRVVDPEVVATFLRTCTGEDASVASAS